MFFYDENGLMHIDYFRIKAMFGSSLPPIVCRRAHVLFTLFLYVLPYIVLKVSNYYIKGRRGRDRMVLGFTTTYAISASHH
jgi:hypothetical protein